MYLHVEKPSTKTAPLLAAFCFIICLCPDTGWFALGQEFIAHPENQTAAIGHYVEFQCNVTGHDNTLRFLVNNLGLNHPNFRHLDSRYFNKNPKITLEVLENSQEITFGRFWIIANEITLEAVKNVTCNLTFSVDATEKASYTAYIVDVTYPNDTKTCTVAPEREAVRYSECDMPAYNSVFHQQTMSVTLLLLLSLSSAVQCLS